MPTFQPNQPIPLATTHITEVDGQPLSIPVDIILRLLPIPSVVLSCDVVVESMLGKPSFTIVLANDMRLNAMLGSFNMNSGTGSLIPAYQPTDVLDRGHALKSVSLSVLNFPVMTGSQMVPSPSRDSLLPHVMMEAESWKVELTGVPDFWDAIETLEKTLGYGITYSGTLTRSDGKSFQSEDAMVILTALRVCLSFARGKSCGVTLVEGQDEGGQESWVRWGAHHTEPWGRQSSWFRTLDAADTLTTLFPNMVLQLEKPEKGLALRRAIDWYIQSNVAAPYVGIILTLASLERLSVLRLGREKRKRESTGDFVGEALDKSDIPADIPGECTALLELKRDWKHGAEAATHIRNDLVHSKPRLAEVSDHAIHDAWNLGQRYIEMMLLKMLDYQGHYVNRLARWDDHDQQILQVPWAREL